MSELEKDQNREPGCYWIKIKHTPGSWKMASYLGNSHWVRIAECQIYHTVELAEISEVRILNPDEK